MNIKTVMMASSLLIPVSMVAGENIISPKHGVDQTNLNKDINPADNFYEYANGGWMKAHPLTPEYARYGMFDLLRENAKTQLKELIDNLDNNPDSKIPGTNAQKIRDLYMMAMDSTKRTAEGITPLKPYLDKVNNFDTSKLAEMLGFLHGGLTSSFFSTGVGSDYNDANINILHIGETGLGIGDRDYYLVKSDENDNILREYEKYVKRIFSLAGYNLEDSQRMWENIINIETEIAKHKMT
ncbi:MAG: M13 family metallopeptidase, partial [Muribaculaceae bacterium]|nr:M13 family metallopeptidase [Muribaculaceae bacterium]